MSVAIYYLKVLLPKLTEVARQKGYALGVHGSLERDLDLIAVPWARKAVQPRELAEALLAAAHGHWDPLEAADPFHREGCPGMKPHGRLCWGIHLGGGPYIDLSVTPPSTDEQAEAATQKLWAAIRAAEAPVLPPPPPPPPPIPSSESLSAPGALS